MNLTLRPRCDDTTPRNARGWLFKFFGGKFSKSADEECVEDFKQADGLLPHDVEVSSHWLKQTCFDP